MGFVVGKLGRNKYVKENGEMMNDAELAAFLGDAYKTIATGGMNKLGDSGLRVSGSRANRGSAERQIHFRDAETYLEYQQRFGEKSMWDILVNHIDGVSKDIALVETYGPNPDHVFRSLLDQLTSETAKANPQRSGRINRLRNSTESLYNFVAGKRNPSLTHISRAGRITSETGLLQRGSVRR